MRIAFELQPMLKDRTGVGWYTYNIIKEISRLKKGNDLIGCVFNFNGRNDLSLQLNDIDIELDTCKFFPYSIYTRLWDFIPVMYNSLFTKKVDIYHFFNFVVPPRINGKVIVTVHDMVYKRFPETMSKANLKRLDKNLQRSVNRADIVVTVSENSKKEIIEYLDVSEDKVRVIPNGVDADIYKKNFSTEELDRVRKKYNLPNRFILYLGTLEPRKNIEAIVEGFALYRRHGGDLKLVIAGKKGWMYDSIFERVKGHSLENEVIFTGYVDENDKPCIYKMCQLFIFPSFYEGFGIPVIEAMAAGVPVITSNTSSLPEVAGDAAVLVAPDDVNMMEDSIAKIISDDMFRKELILKGKKQCEKFSWKKSAEELLRIYEEFEI